MTDSISSLPESAVVERAETDPNTVAPARKLGNLRLVFRYAFAYPKQILIAAAALVVAASATMGVPYAFKLIIDKGFAGGGDIDRWFQYLLLLVVIMAIATSVRFYFVSWLGERVVADIRIAVQKNLLRQPPAYFEANRPSEIASRITTDTTVIEQVVGTTFSVALRNTVMGIIGIILLVALAPRLASMMLFGIPLVVFPIVFLGRKVRTVSRTSQDRIADVGTLIDEVLGVMKIVQAFNQEGREIRRFTDAVETVFGTAKQRIILRAIMTCIVIAIIFGAITFIIWQGAADVAAGRMTGGTIAAFVLYGGLVAGALGALTEVYGDLLRAAGAAGRLGELMAAEPDIAPPAKPVALPQPPRGQVSFEAVKFRYPTRPEVAALENFTLKVNPGETVAVVGPSGAGKSTLFQLAQRFYDPESGVIRVDGVALTSADPAEIRGRMAYVPQETVLFAASARDNLRYGNWLADDDAIWQAAQQANAADFLRELPQGLDTYLGEGGARLSGGQRQRIAIARAVLRNAPILLLDEATSALDAESEKLMQDALDHLMKDRTTIVIAHRLATVRSADRIIVMEQGRIVEEGDHVTLSAAGGLYARLASLQFDA
ncbi:MAG: ABC transporter transmembrane domain-containing protein [Sphingorhabdus sp.]